MSIIELSQDNFDEVIQDNDTVVVDFWSKRCGPCLAFAPTFEALSQKQTDVLFAQVDIEKEPDLANDFNVRSVPFLMIFRREFAVFGEPGVQTAQSLNQLLEDAKTIDIETLRQQVKGSQ